MISRCIEARVLGLVLTSLLLTLATLVALPTPAFAASASQVSSLTADLPKYARFNDPCAPSGVTTSYRVFRAQITGTSASTLTASLNPTGFRAHLGVYDGIFMSDHPLVNCMGNPVGASAGAAVGYTIPTPALLPGFTSRDYLFVVSGHSGSDLGSFTISVDSTNATSVVLTDETPVPVVDATPPVITVPSAMFREATSAAGSAVYYTATANDAVDGAVTPTCTPSSGSTFPLGTTSVRCTAKDSKDNSTSSTFNVTVRDTVPPVLPPVANQTVEATSANGATATYTTPTASDAVDGPRPSSCTPASGSTFALGVTTVTCTATDRADNAGASSFTITVRDTAGPVLTTVRNQTVEATSANGATATYTTPTASDAVDGPRPTSCTPASGSTFALGVTTVTCTATDRADNAGSTGFTITVRDTSSPVLDTVADRRVEATGADGAAVTYTPPRARDSVDASPSVVCSQGSGGIFRIGLTEVSCTATDEAGNTARTTFNVIVSDTTGPAFAGMRDTTAEATSADGATVTYTRPTASDLVSGARTVSCSPAPGVFKIGVTTVTCGATDAVGNPSTTTFKVTVADTSAPTLTPMANMRGEATGPGGAMVTYATPRASDTVDPAPSVSCLPASGSTFPIGSTTVECTATDAADNDGTTTFTVNIADTVGPTLSMITNQTLEATGPRGARASFAIPTAHDVVDGRVDVTCDATSGDMFPLGETTVECGAEDKEQNSNTTSFTITVEDTTGPTLSDVTDLNREATSPDGAPVAYTEPTATDLVSGSRPVTCSPASGSTFPIGDTTVTCSTSDTRDNRNSVLFTVAVRDTSPPSIPAMADVNARATSADGTPVTFAGTATDVVDGDVPLTCSPGSGSVFALGTTTVECAAIDRAENRATMRFDVVVIKNDFTVAGEVTVTGSAKVGRVLTSSDVDLDPSLSGTEATHHWLRDGVVVASATGEETYTLTGADFGHEITHRVTFTAGGYNDVVKTSNRVGPVAKGDIVIGSTTVRGTAQVGQTLTAASAGVVPADAAVTYRWLSGDDELGIGATYVVKPDDLGATITAQANAVREHYEDNSQKSAATSPVAKGVMAVVDTMEVDGRTKVGSTLRSAGALITAPLHTATAYQWFRGSDQISGADGSTYIPTNADAGSVLTLRTTASRVGYEDVVSSVRTTAVIDGGVITLARPTVDGLPVVDEVLTASIPNPSPEDVAVSFAWFVGDRAAGTGTSYVVKPRDVGDMITVKASASRDHFDDVAATSSPTEKVSRATFSKAPATAISGVLRVGGQLSAVVTTPVPAPDSLSYQWFADGAPIPGASNATFDLTAAQKNKTLAVTVTALRAGYVDSSASATAESTVVTNLAPGLTLGSSTSKVRLGQAATLSWSSLDAVTLDASGDWSGPREASGEALVKPSATGTATYVLRARNGSGTTTAQVAVAVSLPARTLDVRSRKSVRADTQWVVRASGLASRERFTVTLGRKVIATGRATKTGMLKRAVTVPAGVEAGKRLLRVTGSLADRTGTRKVTVVRPQPLSMALATTTVRASDRQRVTVKGLLAGEGVVVTYEGDRISSKSAKADSRGVFTMTFGVDVAWGRKTVRALAASDRRTTSKSFSVVRRCSHGGYSCR